MNRLVVTTLKNGITYNFYDIDIPLIKSLYTFFEEADFPIIFSIRKDDEEVFVETLAEFNPTVFSKGEEYVHLHL